MHPEPSLQPPPRQRGGIGFIAHVEPFILWVIMVVYMKMVFGFLRVMRQGLIIIMDGHKHGEGDNDAFSTNMAMM